VKGSIEAFTRASHSSRQPYAKPIAELIDSGHMLYIDGHLRLTDRGRLVTDAVLARLVAADDAAASAAAEQPS
jgi:coproporphyrinogen III oxidase-like Fe-S oxidoreductase